MAGVRFWKQRLSSVLLVTALIASVMVVTESPAALALDVVIDDFDTPSEPGAPCSELADGIPLGFCTFNGGGDTISISNETDNTAPTDTVLQMNVDVTGFAGFIHGFTNEAGDTWVSQDWSTREGFSFYFRGTGSGTTVFIDILENRNPGSTSDDAQRWTVDFLDDFTGWQLLEFSFSAFTEKNVGNGAPTDGFDRFEVHGWALGTLGTNGPRVYAIDQVGLYGEVEPPPLSVGFASANFDIAEGSTGDIAVKLNRPMNESDPSQVSVDYFVEELTPIPGREYTPTSGTLTFSNGGDRELTFPLETFDDGKWEPDERVILRLSSPVDVELGAVQASATIVDNDSFNPLLLDDFEIYPYLWSGRDVRLANPEIAAGEPLAVPGQGAFERVLEVRGVLDTAEIQGNLCPGGNGVIPVVVYSTDEFDATALDHTSLMLGEASEIHVDKKTGVARRHEEDVDRDGRMDLVFHVRSSDTAVPCDAADVPVTGGGVSFARDFPIGQDWGGSDSLSFWFYGQNSGDEITFELLDNRAPDPGPSGWSLAWSDEFNEPAGTAPNPDNWGYENGDGTVNGIPGWGNSELQYYTDSPDNVATDGQGNLVITAREADGELCYYGPCEYTSARLVSKNRAEFAYGKIESRIQVPNGEDGLWPAFWSLGTDIDIVTWPQTGEIDIMEYVSREANEVFGTIHGPGYSGGSAYGDFYTFAEPVSNGYHTFTIEWEPDLIKWYVDDILYHTATPEDVPGEWVFNDPVYLLLNLALGGNFGGPLSPELTFPQEMKVDYVRVYQAPDTAERFETSFIDDFSGWQEIEVPFDSLSRSAEQPANAPDDSLTLTDVWGYGFSSPEDSGIGSILLDQIRLVDTTPPMVAITDDVTEDLATGDVTFTFTFSEPVGDSFTSDDIALEGGDKGAFTRIDARHATLVARPPADTEGTLTVTVSAGTFLDRAGNLNQIGASAEQAYDTPPPPGGPVVIDDFEDGDTSDWIFFDSGGGGPFDDRPYEGDFYLSTGWGGSGSSQVYYGGFFKNFPESAQVTPPSDPWFNVWVLNQSNATVDEYTLEITLREDTDGDGWTNGSEDSIGLNTVFPASSFDDEWTLISAPLSDFFNKGTGGDGTFNGNLDEIVLVVSGVVGGNPSTVEVDFDYFAFTSGGPIGEPPLPPPVGGLVITFDETPQAQLEPFEGLGGSVSPEPGNASNNVASLTKPSTAQLWAGTVVYTQESPAFSVPQIAFADGATTITLRFWTERPAGIPVMLKVENSGNAGQNKEVTVNTTTSGEWETLTFDFAGLDTSLVWDKVAVFPDFFTPEHPGGDYFVDDITFP